MTLKKIKKHENLILASIKKSQITAYPDLKEKAVEIWRQVININ